MGILDWSLNKDKCLKPLIGANATSKWFFYSCAQLLSKIVLKLWVSLKKVGFTLFLLWLTSSVDKTVDNVNK